jgi:hypothetical protein
MEGTNVIVTEGFNSYVERDGKRELINPQQASLKFGSEEVFRFDGKTGVLHISMDQESIDRLVAVHGGLPIAQMCVPAPFEKPIVQNVKEIRPLPTKDGSFLMSLSTSEQKSPHGSPERRRSFFSRFFG